MAEVLLFHHAQGLTPGVVSFADTLRRAGHIVHTPDLFDGRTFDTLEQGMRFVEERGFGALIERGVRAAEGLPAELVYAGFSLGVLPAQMLAEDRPTFRAVNPTTWIKQTNYREQAFHPSLQAFTAQRAELLAVLKPIAPEAWMRTALVTGAGKPRERTVQTYAQWLANHEQSHIRQIERIVNTLRT